MCFFLLNKKIIIYHLVDHPFKLFRKFTKLKFLFFEICSIIENTEMDFPIFISLVLFSNTLNCFIKSQVSVIHGYVFLSNSSSLNDLNKL
jgi:hypothetical protein